MSSRQPLPFHSKFAFGFGQLGEGLWTGAINTFVLFYYNQVLGAPATLVGLALAAALIIDAVTDPLIGSISDNWRSPQGRRHPFMYASTLPLGLSLILLFSPPDALGAMGLLVWLLGFSVLTRMSMTLYHVPHLALGAEMSPDAGERAVLVSFRQFFGTAGSLLAWAIGFGVFFAATAEFENGQLNPAAYTPYAITIAIIIIGSILWSAWGTRRDALRIDPGPAPAGGSRIWRTLRRTFEEILDSLKIRAFRWLFMGVLIIIVMAGVDSALALYVTTYFWQIPSSQLTWFFIAIPIGIMCGALLTRYLLRYLSKTQLLIYGTCWWAMGQVLPISLALLGWFPESGSAAQLPSLLTFRFLQGVGVAQSLIAFGAIIPDLADQQERDTGKRSEGILFGALSFSSKAAGALGSLIAGAGLDLIGWVTAPVAEVPEVQLTRLAVLYGPGIAIFAVVSVWCFARVSLAEQPQRTLRTDAV